MGNKRRDFTIDDTAELKQTSSRSKVAFEDDDFEEDSEDIIMPNSILNDQNIIESEENSIEYDESDDDDENDSESESEDESEDDEDEGSEEEEQQEEEEKVEEQVASTPRKVEVEEKKVESSMKIDDTIEMLANRNK